jgi:hypothetical protein
MMTSLQYPTPFSFTIIAVVALLLLSALPLAANANPHPTGWMYIHVHEGSELITTCEEVMQYNEGNGARIFDIYLWPISPLEDYPEVGIDFLTMTAVFPPEWTVVSAEPATGGTGSFSPAGPGEYNINVTFPECPIHDQSSPLVWMARLEIDVTTEGYFDADGEIISWNLCYPHLIPVYDTFAIPAHAGAGWAHCAQPCENNVLFLELTPDVLELEAYEGEVIVGEILIDAPWLLLPDWLIHESTAPYVTVEELWLDYDDLRLTVTVDATGLEPGLYQSWVRTSIPSEGFPYFDCRSDTEVLFTVLSVTPVREVRWGMLKALYRE